MIWAVLLAAGQGSRLASATGGQSKQFLDWKGAPLYWESACRFAACGNIAGVLFVFPPECTDEEAARIASRAQADFPADFLWKVTAGGTLRQDSVRLGLQALPGSCRKVLIHDAARPFVSTEVIARVLRGLEQEKGVIPAVPVVDTIKIVDNDAVVATPDRRQLVAVQTPQGFDLKVLRLAHEHAERNGWSVTDDAALLERLGIRVLVVQGDNANLKITNPEDLSMLREKGRPCTGFGYDVHKYAVEGNSSAQPSRPMLLGGVPIPDGPRVFAHSDGDVLLHALMDALLGCVGEGDIGQLFPDSSMDFDNVSSVFLLEQVRARAIQKGLCVEHVDITVIAQIPKIAPYRDQIRKTLSRLMDMDEGRVSIKATTEEGLGFTGEKRGIKAIAVVTATRFK